jgi:RND family efflux transporter MFP subunit
MTGPAAQIEIMTATGSPRTFKPLRMSAIALLVILLGFLAYRYFLSPAAKRARDVVYTVKTAPAEKRNVPVILRANGYVSAIQTVDVRPQIQNTVRAIHVREGQNVKAGQLLFTLDARNETALVEKAQAQLARDRADLIDAEATLKRNQELFEKKFISQAVVDTAKSKVDALRGTTGADKAHLAATRVTLSYNRITASIDGRLGAINVHPGSLVQPNGTPLVSIVQLDPIHVSFTIPEADLAHLVASQRAGDVPVFVHLPDQAVLQGKLVFIDNAADPQSGTIRLKAQFDNAERRLWPGAFASVRLTLRTLADAIAIPTPAVINGPKGAFVYVMQADHTVQAQPVKVLANEAGHSAVSGLSPKLRVVVEGAQNLRPGAKVREAATPTSASTSSTPPPSRGSH